ncbi:MAG: DUF423 domain-containing protein [Lewinellaceae bacterium]|nr:DUF423 domain-containing protein [Saprospiraceae bacterium]MCB9345430.1 DUF423 domain-containing protein [Lewinellaceae bacterium]
MSDKFIRIAAIVGLLAVAIGAFGAHGLKPKLTEYQITIFEKGVMYQFFHTMAMLAVGILLGVKTESVMLRRAAWFFLAGIICFSGSLYLLACKDILPFSVSWAGPITPLGGLCFMAGWFLLFSSALSKRT